MRPARAVLIAETLNAVAQFAQGCGRGSAGQPRTNDNNFILSLVRRIDEPKFKLTAFPLFIERAGRNFRVQPH